mmetsp:Transcript_26379/g.57284  ORF Transcript_26379/g.57284 Transcript_26379/m.57284 type:complete len:178 (-) Transcript_26379:792-1325(-)
MSLSSGNLQEYLRLGSPTADQEVEGEVSSSEVGPGPVVLVDMKTMGFQTVNEVGHIVDEDTKNLPQWDVDASQWDPDLMILRPAPVQPVVKQESQLEMGPPIDERVCVPPKPEVSYESIPVNRRCRVPNCPTPDLLYLSMHCCRHRICMQHVKMLEVPLDGLVQRFCQKCTRFHPVV